MTTEERILHKLDLLTKEQEELLVFSALNDVIDRFENIINIPYSEAGIPLITDNYLDKAARRKKDDLELSSEGEALVNADPNSLTPAEQERAVYARGVRDVYNNLKKEHVKVGENLDFLQPIYNDMMKGLGFDQPAPEGGGRRQRTQGAPPKPVKQLMSAFAQQADAVASAVAEGKSTSEIVGQAFPRNGLRMNVGKDAGVDIQVRIKMNPDGKSFKIEQREGGKGKFKTVKGGERVKNFGAAVRNGEKLIVDKAMGRDAQLAGVDVTPKNRRKWLNENVKQDFRGPMTRMEPTTKDKEKFAAEYEKNSLSNLEENGIDENFIEESLRHNASDLFDVSDANEADDLPSVIANSPWGMAKSIFTSVLGGKVRSIDDVKRVVKESSVRVANHPTHGADSSNNEKPGSSFWRGNAEAKSGLGGMFSEWGKAWSSGWNEGWEKGQYFGAHTLGGVKYRAPNSELYRQDPRGYWNERGKLVTMMARADAKYDDAISKAMNMPEVAVDDKGNVITRDYRTGVDDDGNDIIAKVPVNPRSDALEKAMVDFAKAEDSIEAIARDKTGVSLDAVRAHLDEIVKGNKDAMPPGEGFPDRYGGHILRRKLNKNIEKYVPEKVQGAGGLLTGIGERMMGERGRSKDASGEGAGQSQGEQGEARLHAQDRPELSAPTQEPILDSQGNPAIGPDGQPMMRTVQRETGEKSQSAVSTSDREYLQPGDQPPKGVQEYTAERRGKDGKRARYYSRKEAAAVRDQQENGPTKDDTTKPEPEPTTKPEPDDPPPPPPPPVREPTPEEKERLRGQRAAVQQRMQEAGGDKAYLEQEPQREQPARIDKAGENEMASPQKDQYQKAMENEVASAKRVQQHSKARSAKAQARVAKAKADEAEVKARRAEDDREVHIAEILHKLDSNISEIAITSNSEVSDVFKHLDNTIEKLEKGIFGGKKPDVRVGTPPAPSVIESGEPERKPKEGVDYDRHVQPRSTQKADDVEKSGGNPFASLAGHMGRAFREAAKPRKKESTQAPQSTPKPPESATPSSGEYGSPDAFKTDA